MHLVLVSKDNIHELDRAMDMIFDQWGDGFSSSKETKLNKIKELIINDSKFPQVYLLKDGKNYIGSFSILEHELKGSALSPWLACVVIDKKYRCKGYGRVLLEHIEYVLNKNFSEIYLTTELVGYYEKIGFKLLKLIENNGKNNRLYARIIKR